MKTKMPETGGLYSSERSRVVALARAESACYGTLADPQPAPELPSKTVRSAAAKAIRDLFLNWRLDAARAGSPEWNPLGEMIPPGSRVVLKPNWVLHYNQSPHGLDCLITHTSVVEAVLEYVLLTQPASIVLGDAPIQGCDFEKLIEVSGAGAMLGRFRKRGVEIALSDFRRTVLLGRNLGDNRIENRKGTENYVLFDLKEESLLEPLSGGDPRFRVTMYNPDLLSRTHQLGRHQYLIAREIMEADVFINLPKLKTHKKSGVTGAIKNLIGINGNKEFLPHHRKGSPPTGGDCYGAASWFKERAEDLLDSANRGEPGKKQAALARWAEIALRCAEVFGADDNLEGSWYGNDTIWRTALDLQRILGYGGADGRLSGRPVRRVISITDAIVAGEGEGPLAPEPVNLGLVTGALSPAAAEWVHARLMGFDPEKIPIIARAFAGFSYPLVDFRPSEIVVRTSDGEISAESVMPPEGRVFRAARGWQGHCELPLNRHDSEAREQVLVD